MVRTQRSIRPRWPGLPVLAGLILTTLPVTPVLATSYVHRSLNLARGDWELGLGAGLAHEPGNLGLGFNLELGVGLTSAIELRLRTGLRAGTDGRALEADLFGRPYDTETNNTGGDTLANPELGVKWALLRSGMLSLALDTRITLPTGGDLGLMFGLPLTLHFGGARVDSGIYVPFVFRDGKDYNGISIPLHVFFDVSGGTYLGPITGIVFDSDRDRVPLGLALGTMLAHSAEVRSWILFPDVSHSGAAKGFGVGVGLNLLF